MKNWCIVLIIISLLICLFSSCKYQSVSNEQSSSDTNVPSKTSVNSSSSLTTEITTTTTAQQVKIIQGTETLIKNDQYHMEIQLPDNWKGRYIVEEYKTDENVFSYHFYNKANYGVAGGSLFSLFARKNENAYGLGGCIDIIGQNDQYSFYAGHPSDLQCSETDDSLKKDYQEMCNDVVGIYEDFLTRNHITAFTDESATTNINGYDVEIRYQDPRINKDIQNKANQVAIQFVLALCDRDWDGIKAASTEDFYINLKTFYTSCSSDINNKAHTASSLINIKCKSIYDSVYLQKGTNQSVYIDINCVDNHGGCYEIHLSKNSNGDFIVSGMNYQNRI